MSVLHNEEKRIVEQLSAFMLTRLALNRHRPIWASVPNDRLCKLLHDNLSDLALSLYAGRTEDVLTECADAANYLAMIADNALGDGVRAIRSVERIAATKRDEAAGKATLTAAAAGPETPHGTLKVNLGSDRDDAPWK